MTDTACPALPTPTPRLTSMFAPHCYAELGKHVARIGDMVSRRYKSPRQRWCETTQAEVGSGRATEMFDDVEVRPLRRGRFEDVGGSGVPDGPIPPPFAVAQRRLGLRSGAGR